MSDSFSGPLWRRRSPRAAAGCTSCFLPRSHTVPTFFYDSPYVSVVFDHDQAYRRVKRSCHFRCLVPFASPGGSSLWTGSSTTSRPATWSTSSPGVCCSARQVLCLATACRHAPSPQSLPRSSASPPGHHIDYFIAALLAEDTTAVDDLWEFPVDVLCFRLRREVQARGVPPLPGDGAPVLA